VKQKGKKATDVEKSWPQKQPEAKKLSHRQETM
jgi:hypothetical protein